MPGEHLMVTRDGFVATIWLNRPGKLNVWNAAMEVDLRRAMAELSADEAVRVIVLTGKGRAFCAGVDIEALNGMIEGRQNVSQPPLEVQAAMGDGDFEQRYSYLLATPKPLICALNGAAAGVGLVLALYCDIRYMASHARLAAPFARRGLVAEHGIAWILPRLIGLSRATDWLLSGRTLTALEAERWGLVSAVFDSQNFENEVSARAQEMATSVSPRSTAVIKRQLYEATEQSLAAACRVAAKEVSTAIRSEDFQEGVRHFREKRVPAFTGR